MAYSDPAPNAGRRGPPLARCVQGCRPMRASALLALGLCSVTLSLEACKKSESTEQSTKPKAPAVKAAVVTASEALTPIVLTLTGMIAADQRSEVTADT